MGAHAQLLDEQIDLAEQRKRIDELEADEQKSAEEHRQDEGKNLVVGQRATENADADKACTQQELKSSKFDGQSSRH